MNKLVLVLMLAVSTPAFAGSHCQPLADALADLATEHDQHPRVSAKMGDGSTIIVTVDSGGNWTAIQVSPNGRACIVAGGDEFQS